MELFHLKIMQRMKPLNICQCCQPLLSVNLNPMPLEQVPGSAAVLRSFPVRSSTRADTSMDRYQCFVCAECILGTLMCTFLFSGSILVSYRWKPTYDDRAQKTWASGDCLIIDHSRVKKHGSNDNAWYYACLHVQLPPDLDAETYDNGTAVDFCRAFKWPHQAETEDFDTEKEANRFQESHPIDTVSTCFWDPKKPSKVAMTNRGGDWTEEEATVLHHRNPFRRR